jgi:hypothetical protein
MYVEAAIAEWIFHQEKSTLKNARKGYSYCGFALKDGPSSNDEVVDEQDHR